MARGISGGNFLQPTRPPATTSGDNGCNVCGRGKQFGRERDEQCSHADGEPAAVAPTISRQPANQTYDRPAGDLLGSRQRTAPLSYQWQKNGTGIGGATSSAIRPGNNTAAITVQRLRRRGKQFGRERDEQSSQADGEFGSGRAPHHHYSGRPASSVSVGQDRHLHRRCQRHGATELSVAEEWHGHRWGNFLQLYDSGNNKRRHGATFVAVISNSVGSATSNPATLTVSPAAVAPTIFRTAANQTGTVRSAGDLLGSRQRHGAT